MKLKEILIEGWEINIHFPVSVDGFNQVMRKHGAVITWKTGKAHKQDQRGFVFLEFEGVRIELVVGRTGWVTSGVGRTHSLDGMENQAKLNKLKELFNQEFGREWFWQDEEEEDDERFNILEDFPETRKKRVKRLPQQHNFMNFDKPSVLRNPNVKHLGSGSFASAYTHKDRPHDIRRISKPAVDPDGYHVYIEALKNNPDHDNPYFPQIHEVTKYQGQGKFEGDKTVLSVKAGRLRRISELRTEEIQAILVRWFGENYEKILRKVYPLGGAVFRNEELSEYILPGLIRKIIEEKQFRKKVVDQDLLRAAIFIDKKVLGKGVRTDLGINNLMFRRSPSGIQIVLTDPVA